MKNNKVSWKKHSEKTKKKQSESTKKFWESPEGLLKKQRMSKRITKKLKGKTYEQLYGNKAKEIKNKIGDAQRGIPKSEEHNRKNSEAHKGKKRKPFSKKWRKKLGNATRGKTYEEIYGDRADEIKKKRSKSLKGRIFSEKHRKRLSESHKKGVCKHKPGCICLRCRMERGELRGKNSPAWKDGISFEPYSTDWTKTLKRSIRERDHYTCQMCGKYGNIVHHWNYDKLNCNPEYLITLCQSCHSKTNFNRNYWIKYFEKFMSIKGWTQENIDDLKKSEKI